MRFSLVCLLILGSSASLTAQYNATVVPPAERSLDALNLKTEWTTAIPLFGRQDAVGLIQVTDGNQLFVQTKAGLLLALDSKTGAQQWSLKYDAINAPVYPIAVNDRFVIAVNLVTMYCVHRYTGLVEFKHKLPLVPSSGPALDRDTAYITMNGQRVTAFAMPEPIKMPERRANANAGVGSLAGAVDFRIKNPADVVATRYPGTVRKSANISEQFEESKITLSADKQLTGGALATQRSPSLSVLPSVRPPYNAFDDRGKYIVRSESLSTVHSMRQPYSLSDPTGASIQRTPSLAAIPPSVAAVYEQSSLLARPFEPATRWVVGSTVRLTHAPLTTNFRVWMSGDSPVVQAYLKDDKSLQLSARMPNQPAAQPGQAGDIGYFPLIDGNLMAFDLAGGGGAVAKVVWRSNVGGAMNRKPLLTADSVFQGGDTSGVARIDRKSGDVTWRTDDTADTVLSVNDEVVYVRDKQGVLRAYDKNRVSDPATKRAVQLGSLNLSGFTVPTMNEFTDRLYMASETGLLLCLRDKSPKYAAAVDTRKSASGASSAPAGPGATAGAALPPTTDALAALLKAVKDHKEAKRDPYIAFPEALAILENAPKNNLGANSFGMETYSTQLDEDKLIKQFGNPDEQGNEEVKYTDPKGLPNQANSKMLRYGWLRIYVKDKGEIWYVRRPLN